MLKIFVTVGVCLTGFSGFCQGLVVKSNSRGISFLSYRNTVLLNTEQKKGASFTTEGYKVIHKGGKVQGSWSFLTGIEQHKQQNEWTYKYSFGNLFVRHHQVKDTLFIDLTITNTSASDTLLGVNIILLQLQFPQRPKGFQQYRPYYHYNLDAPSVIPADYGLGKVVLSNEDAGTPVFTGLIDVNNKSNDVLYKVFCSTLPFYGMVTSGIPNLERKLAPGRSLTYRLGLRFYASGTPDEVVAPSVIASYKNINKVRFSWKDRRPMGMLFLSSVSKQNPAANPRGWLPGKGLNFNTARDIEQLKKEVLEYARKSIAILKDMNAQGMITWDIEGQEFPHAISYVGSPDKLRQVAPEMDAIADEYFDMFRKAGLRTGVCIRPQEFIFSKDGKSAKQQFVKDPASVLIRKIKYARKRWGCTLFYIDSNLDSNWVLLNPVVFKKVCEAVPDVLLIPEHQNIKYFEYGAPYEEMRLGTTVLNGLVAAAYPTAFMVINTGDGLFDASGKRVVSDETLKKSLQQGNIFLFRAWYPDQPSYDILKKVITEVNSNRR